MKNLPKELQNPCQAIDKLVRSSANHIKIEEKNFKLLLSLFLTGATILPFISFIPLVLLVAYAIKNIYQEQRSHETNAKEHNQEHQNRLSEASFALAIVVVALAVGSLPAFAIPLVKIAYDYYKDANHMQKDVTTFTKYTTNFVKSKFAQARNQ
jgi:hypothetical protein